MYKVILMHTTMRLCDELLAIWKLCSYRIFIDMVNLYYILRNKTVVYPYQGYNYDLLDRNLTKFVFVLVPIWFQLF
jgi:hypothetical protein